jgi:hypothetical protein
MRMLDKHEWHRRLTALWEGAAMDSQERDEYRRILIEAMRHSDCKETRRLYWTHQELMAELDLLDKRLKKRRSVRL